MKSFICILVVLASSFVASAQDKFNWVIWNKLPEKIKTDLKAVKTDSKTSLYNAILQYKKDDVEELEVMVAVVDMDKDGKSEYAVSLRSGMWCGSTGCAIQVYKDGGKKQIHFTDEVEGVRPSKNGVISSEGKLIPFEIIKIN